VSTSLGLGRRRAPHLAVVPWARQFGPGALGQDAGQTMASDLYHGGWPPRPIEIPMSWISGRATFRQDPPLARAEVQTRGADTARSVNTTAVINGRQWVFTATLDSVADGDAAALAAWVTAYYTDPLPRASAMTLTLNSRTPTEIWRILGVVQGSRIRITGTPAATWPDGSTDLVVECVSHRVGADLRTVTWALAPIAGAAVGTAGPWFYSDSSSTAGSDAVPF
jgi:hypothetical protein